jgi:hypothetical protein
MHSALFRHRLGKPKNSKGLGPAAPPNYMNECSLLARVAARYPLVFIVRKKYSVVVPDVSDYYENMRHAYLQ